MIKAIEEIGTRKLESLSGVGNRAVIEALCEEVAHEFSTDKKNPDNKEPIYLIKVIFDVKNKEIRFDTKTELSPNAGEEYLCLKPGGPNSPRIFLTTRNLDYLLAQTIPALKEESDSKLGEDNRFSQNLKSIYDTLFTNNPCRKGEESRYSKIADPSFIKGLSDESRQELTEIKNSADKGQDKIKSFVKALNKHQENLKGLNKKINHLYTICFNDEDNLLCEEPDYHEIAYRYFFEENFSKAKDGRCHLCGESKPTTQDTGNFKNKFYITDKFNFAYNLDKNNFIQRLSFCSDCYKGVLVGESYISKNLSTTFDRLRVLIIPRALFSTDFDFNNIEEKMGIIKNRFNVLQKLEDLEDVKELLHDSKKDDFQENQITVDFMFYKKDQQATKVLNLIKDIPPSRLSEINQAQSDISYDTKKLLGTDRQNSWSINFRQLFHNLPINEKEPEKTSQMILEILDCALSNRPLNKTKLIGYFIQKVKNEYYTSQQHYETFFIKNMLKKNQFLKFFENIGILKLNKEVNMPDVQENLVPLEPPKEARDYFREYGYGDNPEKAALFMLGYVMAEIGAMQYKSYKMQAGDSDENAEDSKKVQGKKPVLNLVNFQGMNLEKLKILANRLMEKGLQWNRSDFLKNETDYCRLKIYFDQALSNSTWSLTAQENVFHLLSGYAFKTYKIIISAKGSKQ
jgi:CRISPR-associated protein Csh1